jgi:hypothetical protein
MSQIAYRANLTASGFPFLVKDFGRSVVLKQFDQNYVPSTTTSAADVAKEVGVPQMYFCENVLPTAEGFKSVSYRTVTPTNDPSETNFIDVHQVRDIDENHALISFTGDARVFICIAPLYTWVSIPAPAGLRDRLITTAHVQGTTYIYLGKQGCYKYNFSTNLLEPVTLAGLNGPTILGIVSSQGYLVAWSDTSVAWSSTIDPTDFVPSITTGAGGGSIEGTKGAITVLKEQSQGFIVYTTKNAVAAVYSNNARYPFNYRPISGAGGLNDLRQIGGEESGASHWIYGTAGLQQITTQQSLTIFPEVTDFVSGKYIDSFNWTTKEIESDIIDGTIMKRRLEVIASRYLVISYGTVGPKYTHALVYDLALKRWGKLRLTHVSCFACDIAPPELDLPKESIAFLTESGSIQVVEMDSIKYPGKGVAYLGNYKHTRTRQIQLQAVDISKSRSEGTLELLDKIRYESGTKATMPLYLARVSENNLHYISSAVAASHSLVLLGSFDLSYLELHYNVHGRR